MQGPLQVSVNSLWGTNHLGLAAIGLQVIALNQLKLLASTSMQKHVLWLIVYQSILIDQQFKFRTTKGQHQHHFGLEVLGQDCSIGVGVLSENENGWSENVKTTSNMKARQWQTELCVFAALRDPSPKACDSGCRQSEFKNERMRIHEVVGSPTV